MSAPTVRFAPSPTGYLHVGGARTALFNWLYARRTRGKFLLRIEDTDRERSTPQAVEAIFAGLRWLGIDWDAEPLFQSSRLTEHRRLVADLRAVGAAYPCFCDPAELETQRREAEKRGEYWNYPGVCRQLSVAEAEERIAQGAVYAVRFKTPAGETHFQDAVHGEIRVKNAELDDFILLRRDSTPIYQVAVVADDAYMGITHVIRGDDHISNTPKQILIYRALGLPVPQFAHIPLILGPDKKRLSKRHGATSVIEYRERGYLPTAMRNFLALLGWNPGSDRELLSLEEMISEFSLERINASGAVFDESKLDWMNGRYIAALSDLEVWYRVQPYLRSWCERAACSLPNDEFGVKLAGLFKERLRRFSEAPELMEYFLIEPPDYDAQGLKKFGNLQTQRIIEFLLKRLVNQDLWDKTTLEREFDAAAGEFEVKRGELIHPVRLAVTGRTSSPGIFEVLELLGRETVFRRLQRFCRRCEV